MLRCLSEFNLLIDTWFTKITKARKHKGQLLLREKDILIYLAVMILIAAALNFKLHSQISAPYIYLFLKIWTKIFKNSDD